MKAVASNSVSSMAASQWPEAAAQWLPAVPRQSLGRKNLPFGGQLGLQWDMLVDSRRMGANRPPSAPLRRSTKCKGFT